MPFTADLAWTSRCLNSSSALCVGPWGLMLFEGSATYTTVAGDDDYGGFQYPVMFEFGFWAAQNVAGLNSDVLGVRMLTSTAEDCWSAHCWPKTEGDIGFPEVAAMIRPFATEQIPFGIRGLTRRPKELRRKRKKHCSRAAPCS